MQIYVLQLNILKTITNHMINNYNFYSETNIINYYKCFKLTKFQITLFLLIFIKTTVQKNQK